MVDCRFPSGNLIASRQTHWNDGFQVLLGPDGGAASGRAMRVKVSIAIRYY